MHSSLLIVAALGIFGFSADNVNYDAARQGQLPPGWSAGAGQKWEVRSDKTAPSHPNVLQGSSGSAGSSGASRSAGTSGSSGTTGEYDAPFALFDRVVCRDGDLSVKFRIDGSQHGNAAGVVWRYRDAKNYYLLSLSADDRSIVLRRVRNGVSEVVSTTGGRPASVGVAEDIRAGQWHVVKVVFRGPRVQVFFGNRSLFTADDSGILTAGKTGLWAKGASGAKFDDFRIDKKS